MKERSAILITGGAKRIGAALAKHFAAHGYDIALHYNRSEKEALRLKKDIEKLGAACALFQHDLQDVETLPWLMKDIRVQMRHCIALVNNASIFERGEFAETDEALFDRQFTVNLKAPFFLTQAFAKTFGKGCAINILDTDISQNHVSHFAYLLSKKALAEFTPMAARALGPKIRVNGVCPGCLLPSNENDEAYEKKMATLIPLKSHPSLKELGEAVRWLIERQHITGQILYVDGGMHVL